MTKTNFVTRLKKQSEDFEKTKIQVKPNNKEELKVKRAQKVKKYGDGFWKVVFDEESKELVKIQKISSPIEILAMTRTEDNSGWGVLLQWTDPDKNIHTWAMPWDMLNKPGNEWLSYLQGHGFSVTPEGIMNIKEFLASADTYTTKRARLATKTGWSEDARTFALPHKNLGAEKPKK